MIVLFDNRRMAAITALQQAQYGTDYRTNDGVAVDYVQLAVRGRRRHGLLAADDARTNSQARSHRRMPTTD